MAACDYFRLRPVAWSWLSLNASVLGDFGLPEGQFIPALIGFNIGVEVGQLTVVAVAAILLTLPFGRFDWYRRAIAMPCVHIHRLGRRILVYRARFPVK